MHDRRRHCHAGFGTQPIRSHIQCLQGTLSAAAVSAISIDPAEQPCCQGSQSLRPQPFSSLSSSGAQITTRRQGHLADLAEVAAPQPKGRWIVKS
jgi:hypothetical protein